MLNIFGFFIIYGIVILLIPYYLLKYAPFSIFITWFANVDIVSNILSINFPNLFKNVYDINPSNFSQYVSYNTISLIALSGIFIHGLRHHADNKYKTFITMIIMSIVTWTLPTQGIPLLNRMVDNFMKEREIDDKYKTPITVVISLMFVFAEWFIIHYFVDNLSDNTFNMIARFMRNIL